MTSSRVGVLSHEDSVAPDSSVITLTTEAGLLERAESWSDLLGSSSGASPFQSLEWILASWRAYGSGRRLRVMVAERRGALTAALPLVESRRGPFRVLEFLGSPRSDFVDALVRDGEEGSLDRILESLSSSRGWDLLHIDELSSPSALGAAIDRAGARLSLKVMRREASRMPHLVLDRTWEQLLAGRSRKFRQKLRRYQEKLEETGPLEMVRLIDGIDPEEILRTIAAIESRSWKIGAGADRFQKPEDARFTREFLRGFATRRWARVWLMNLSGSPIAYLLAFRHADRLYDYSTAFDPQHASCSPGMLLLSRSIETAIAEKAVEFNFLRGNESYKARWTETARTNEDLLVWKQGLSGYAAGWACVRWRWAARKSAFARRAALVFRGRATPATGKAPGGGEEESA